MTSEPRISVIVRTVDRPARLAEALASLAEQTLRSFEAVIVDMSDGGVDDVVTRCGPELPAVQHLRIGRRLLRPAALNAGIRAARGEAIAVLDDDNLYDPTHLQTLVDGLARTGADVVYTGVRRTTYTPDGRWLASEVRYEPFDLARLVAGNFIHTSGTAFWKRTWSRIGGYDLRFPCGQDFDFLLRVARTGTIVGLSAVTAESRSFTGRPGIANHLAETANVRRSQAGLYWRHRDLFAAELRRRWREGRPIASGGRVGPPRPRWWLPFQLAHDLAGWWWHCDLPARRQQEGV